MSDASIFGPFRIIHLIHLINFLNGMHQIGCIVNNKKNDCKGTILYSLAGMTRGWFPAKLYKFSE